MTPGSRVCRKCCQELPLEAFNYRVKGSEKRRSQCKKCEAKWHTAYYRRTRERQIRRAAEWYRANPERARATGRVGKLRRNYGLTPEDYSELLAAQEGRCAICQADAPGGKGVFVVEHCHSSNAIRGLTCHGCNVALGGLKDSPANAAAAIVYLVAHGQAFSTEDINDFLSALDGALSIATQQPHKDT